VSSENQRRTGDAPFIVKADDNRCIVNGGTNCFSQIRPCARINVVWTKLIWRESNFPEFRTSSWKMRDAKIWIPEHRMYLNREPFMGGYTLIGMWSTIRAIVLLHSRGIPFTQLFCHRSGARSQPRQSSSMSPSKNSWFQTPSGKSSSDRSPKRISKARMVPRFFTT